LKGIIRTKLAILSGLFANSCHLNVTHKLHYGEECRRLHPLVENGCILAIADQRLSVIILILGLDRPMKKQNALHDFLGDILVVVRRMRKRPVYAT
jgi:hypothetical protein